MKTRFLSTVWIPPATDRARPCISHSHPFRPLRCQAAEVTPVTVTPHRGAGPLQTPALRHQMKSAAVATEHVVCEEASSSRGNDSEESSGRGQFYRVWLVKHVFLSKASAAERKESNCELDFLKPQQSWAVGPGRRGTGSLSTSVWNHPDSFLLLRGSSGLNRAKP